MDINRILAELRAERDQINQAISVIQALVDAQRRRGRKPGWFRDFDFSTVSVTPQIRRQRRSVLLPAIAEIAFEEAHADVK